MKLFSVAFDDVREVQLFVQFESAEQRLRLLVHLVVILADEELDKVTKRLVDQLIFGIAALEELDLLRRHLLHLIHLAYQELVLVSLVKTLLGLLEESLSHLVVLLLVSLRNVVLDLS